MVKQVLDQQRQDNVRIHRFTKTFRKSNDGIYPISPLIHLQMSMNALVILAVMAGHAQTARIDSRAFVLPVGLGRLARQVFYHSV